MQTHVYDYHYIRIFGNTKLISISSAKKKFKFLSCQILKI